MCLVDVVSGNEFQDASERINMSDSTLHPLRELVLTVNYQNTSNARADNADSVTSRVLTRSVNHRPDLQLVLRLELDALHGFCALTVSLCKIGPTSYDVDVGTLFAQISEIYFLCTSKIGMYGTMCQEVGVPS